MSSWFATTAWGGTPLSDPLPSSSLLAAVSWLQQALLGTIAVSVAVIAVAALGLSMFMGRVPVRRGGTVLLGCFILFGASVIAAGIQRLATGEGEGPPPLPQRSQSPLVVPETGPDRSQPQGYDPYAGASVPHE